MDTHKSNGDPPIIRIHSNIELESLEDKAVLDFEDENLSSKDSIGSKKQSFDGSDKRSLSALELTSNFDVPRNTILGSIKIVVFSTKINLLIPFGPLAILISAVTGSHGWVFFLSLVGIIPMAERLGFATEQLAYFTGPTVGGLLNATFGNATELIISIYALKNGMIRVVQQSLLGSILSNMLLVLGCAFFSGGIVVADREQVFSKGSATMNSSLLLMAVMGLLFPAVLHSTRTELHFGKSELALSRFSSCIMLVAYAGYLYFQLKSQKNLYVQVNERDSQTWNADEDEAPEISKWEAIIWLFIITTWISVLSEYLVNAIEGASRDWKIPIAFISVILLPIVGNAAEHAGAVIFAMKDKLDISLGVAIGSSTQISMFGIPILVIIGWITGHPMDLNFQLFETATLFITVIVVAFMLQEGTSNYFKGLMLIFCYLIVSASFFVHMDPIPAADPPKPGN
ncbi:vacuolar cation/proton exchanger 5-like isoform X2 [Mercurialis annua]|uniref:vacuolar cation/proton exchanger 5-like isoform X2 n=1 Tax=Mercurialis annua TaxID=3986 RepID=UPI00215E9DB6|nr:vacuolar cation/proton exchanger 5-like isoform X2 [Mercurialis annua]